ARAGTAATDDRGRAHATVRRREPAADRARVRGRDRARHRGRDPACDAHAAGAREALRGGGGSRRHRRAAGRQGQVRRRRQSRRLDRLGRQRGCRTPARPVRLTRIGWPGMKVLFVNEAGVHALLPMRECIDLMRQALTALARGDAVLPLRSMVRLPDQSGLLGLMPGYLGEPRSFGLKVVSVMPGNHGTGYDSHQGVVMLFGLVHGEPLAILDATAITAIRTAAASAAATDVLAREDAGDLALIGSGAQARTHLAAMRVVRKLRRVRVWS